ncbi:unnamed protein product [Miscanthus lutarioriparius]|uniref:Uncharacterized protein n=1 Tax=Miscanthus lutarioriparius TaxID=422564 RepID=A0A811NPI4_9POAL|nr:unnamed protein product [Miscanthus lutarioriparius]
MSAHSFLMLEVVSIQHDAAAEATQALGATHGDQPGSGNSSASTGTKDGSSSSGEPRRDNRSNNSGNYSRSNNRDHRRGRGNGNTNGNGGGGGSRSNNSNASTNQSGQWAAGHNPWQGMVQAWPMPFRAPGAGVLGSHPPFQPHQAMTAYHQQAPAPDGVFDTGALYAALQSAGVPHQPTSTSDWYFDTGATSHMSSSPDTRLDKDGTTTKR